MLFAGDVPPLDEEPDSLDPEPLSDDFEDDEELPDGEGLAELSPLGAFLLSLPL
ncbi:MAG: hypothetical protein VX498_12785 [Myxococcota bacterium]|nr:hypothetical protein [Myxococcota bacterium]